mmetsp:Transcript_80400/g.259843  ORF Transcript_80400/g.259843 Transcript_80400/m.259843 type:complete len:111 (-) Transcript_80400:71-403(-)
MVATTSGGGNTFLAGGGNALDGPDGGNALDGSDGGNTFLDGSGGGNALGTSVTSVVSPSTAAASPTVATISGGGNTFLDGPGGGNAQHSDTVAVMYIGHQGLHSRFAFIY